MANQPRAALYRSQRHLAIFAYRSMQRPVLCALLPWAHTDPTPWCVLGYRQTSLFLPQLDTTLEIMHTGCNKHAALAESGGNISEMHVHPSLWPPCGKQLEATAAPLEVIRCRGTNATTLNAQTTLRARDSSFAFRIDDSKPKQNRVVAVGCLGSADDMPRAVILWVIHRYCFVVGTPGSRGQLSAAYAVMWWSQGWACKGGRESWDT